MALATSALSRSAVFKLLCLPPISTLYSPAWLCLCHQAREEFLEALVDVIRTAAAAPK